MPTSRPAVAHLPTAEGVAAARDVLDAEVGDSRHVGALSGAGVQSDAPSFAHANAHNQRPGSEGCGIGCSAWRRRGCNRTARVRSLFDDGEPCCHLACLPHAQHVATRMSNGAAIVSSSCGLPYDGRRLAEVGGEDVRVLQERLQLLRCKGAVALREGLDAQHARLLSLAERPSLCDAAAARHAGAVAGTGV
eukprot:scaffold4720_cov382-Prasinococcus_capsulatus_cf.AAC.8